jgi:hypothetical protein
MAADQTAPSFCSTGMHLPARPYRHLPHGAQGRVQDDRPFSGRPSMREHRSAMTGSSLTGLAPCYAWMGQWRCWLLHQGFAAAIEIEIAPKMGT